MRGSRVPNDRPKEWRAEAREGAYLPRPSVGFKALMGFVGKWYGFGLSASYDAGIRAREKGLYADAVEQFRASLSDPVDPGFRKVIGRTLANALGRLAKERMRGLPAEARDLLLEGIELEPGFADLWLSLARCERALGREGCEREAVAKALELNPSYGEALLHQAALSVEDQEWAQASELLEAGLKGPARLQGADSEEAAVLIGAKSPRAAFVLLNIRPKDPEVQALVDEADLAGMRRQFGKATDFYRKALETAPQFADIRCRLAQALMELGDLDAADLELAVALELNPRYAEALAIRGVLAKRRGDSDAADRLFRLALDADPNQTIALQETLRRGI